MEFSPNTCNICNQEHAVIVGKLCMLCKHEMLRANRFLAQVEKSTAFLLLNGRIIESAVKLEPEEQIDDKTYHLWTDTDKITEPPSSSTFIDDKNSSYAEGSSPMDIKIEYHDVKVGFGDFTVTRVNLGSSVHSRRSFTMEKQKRKALTLEDKYDIIKKIEKGDKQSVICREMGLPRSTVASTWQKRKDILSSYGKVNVRRKRMKKTAHEELDKGLLQWFTQTRKDNIPVSGPILQEQASKMGSKISKRDFTCSRSWIERFKQRHCITGGKIVGESRSLDVNVVHNWLSTIWPDLRNNYSSNDIFNANETGLFYNLTPDKTLKFKGETCAGGKLSEVRITVLVAANMTGTEKRKLLIIGNSANPRYFKNKMLPVKYRSNNKSWMTSNLFRDELLEWDTELQKKDRKILLLVDNCPAHPEVPLNHIKLVFMPPNTNSKLQPMEQGVIRSLKGHYRNIMLMKMLEAIGRKEHFSVSILDAVNFIHLAWQKVTRETIANCFKQAGFLEEKATFDSDDELPISEWLKKDTKDPEATDIETAIEMEIRNKIMQDFDFEKYVTIDDKIVSTESLTEEQIIQSVTSGTNVAISERE